jgi:hypothetical protein
MVKSALLLLVVSAVHGFVAPPANLLLMAHHRGGLGRTLEPAPAKTDLLILAAKNKKDDVNSTPTQRDNKQLYGALAIFAVGCLFDFFVTHHGVGPWDPNYVL